MPAVNEANLNENPDIDNSTRSKVQFAQTQTSSAPLQLRVVSLQPCNTQPETPHVSRKRTKPHDIRAEYL